MACSPTSATPRPTKTMLKGPFMRRFVSYLSESDDPEKLAGRQLAVRIGIATGPVVVGDVIGEGTSMESAVVGETPNLAARLQSVAAENSVVISALTRKLAAG